MEVAAGLEPAKTGFADQRLGLFGIATPEMKLLREGEKRPDTPLVLPVTTTLALALWHAGTAGESLRSG